MSEEQAALAFAQSKPTEWEAFKATWIKNNAPIVESLLVDPPVEEIPTVKAIEAQNKVDYQKFMAKEPEWKADSAQIKPLKEATEPKPKCKRRNKHV